MPRDPAARKLRPILEAEGEGTRNYHCIDVLRKELAAHLDTLGSSFDPLSCATVKIDGTSAKIRGGRLFVRRDVKVVDGAAPKNVPQTWVAEQDEPDDNGHMLGFYDAMEREKDNKWALTAVYGARSLDGGPQDGLFLHLDDAGHLVARREPLAAYEGFTLEIIGRAIQNNPYKFPRKDVPGFENSADQHFFVIHGEFKFKEPLLRENMTMSGIREFLEKHKVEGVVLHLPGNVYFKIHCGHVGLKWPLKDESANFYF